MHFGFVRGSDDRKLVLNPVNLARSLVCTELKTRPERENSVEYVS